jgi:hypothetical protein
VVVSVPEHIKSSRPIEDFRAFLELLRSHPEKHTRLTPDLIMDPEVLFFMDFLADSEGYAHSLQVHSDGQADYLKHRLAELNKGVRWIARNADQDALGLFLPATAEHQGFQAEKAKGNLRVLPGGASIEFALTAGLLAPREARQTEALIKKLLAGGAAPSRKRAKRK